MALSAKYSQLDAGLDGFLFAECGCEASGLPVTVLSALSRLGIDPWLEGARLAKLPRDVAARELAPLIAQLPTGERVSAEVLAIAERLTALLPQQRKWVDAPVNAPSRRPGSPALWLACVLLVLVALGAFGLLPGL